MRIAILGSVTTKIPPEGQAAIERLAYQQALGLAKRGHWVLLFALKGSHIPHPNVRVITVGEGETRSGSGAEGAVTGEELYGISYRMRLEITNIANVMTALKQYEKEYDVVLNNLRGEAVIAPFLSLIGKPLYHVLHMPVFPQLAEVLKKYKVNLISISNAQRRAFPDLTYAGTVYNAVDTTEFAFSPRDQDYVLYLGSIGRNKNPADAVRAAKKAGVRLMIGGRIKDQAYYEKEIAPFIDGFHVVWIGEKKASEIVKLYQGAKAFLFPTLWEEPFGLVAIEAMSCGTPVIAYPNGALPEIVEDGKNGYLVKNVDEMVAKIKELHKLDRKATRASVEAKFTIDHMIASYEKVLSHNHS